jgi:hypothetical protein
MPVKDAVGPVRAVASRTRDVMDTVVAIAREVHPEAELNALGRMLPVQLELGVPADVVWLARLAGALLLRQMYLDLSARKLVTPQAIGAATDEVLGECVGDDQEAVGRLRAWSELAEANTDEAPSLEDLLGLPSD